MSVSPCGARSGDGRGRLMVAAFSNGGGNGQKRGGGGKERCNNQIEATVASGDSNCHQRSTAEMDDGAMVQRGGSKTTARIELKRRMADGGCQTVVLAVVDIATVVLNQPSSTMFSTATALRHRPIPRGNKPTTAVVVTVDAKSSSSSSSSSGSGATTEETNKRDGEGCGEKRR